MNQGHLRQPHSVKMTANSLSSALARNLMNSFNRLSVRLDLRKFSAIFYTKAGCRRCPQDDTSLFSGRGNKHTVALHHPRVMLACIILLLAAIVLPAWAESTAPKPISFSHQVRPIISDKCFKCHGPDAENNKSEFRLDTFENATADLGGYAGIVPGNPKASRLIQTIHSKDLEDVMPPPEAKMTLTEKEKAILTQWIVEGAKYEKHWAFTELAESIAVPTSSHPSAQTPIDHFIAQTLSEHKLTPAPEASRELWLRRLSFDLSGLPPTLAELDAFLTDESPQAYENQVNRLLADPAYAERMATEWLDVARYSDSYGYQIDRHRTVWQWRDWVIRSFQGNLPYNDFITHQLAGDMIPNATQETKLATAFNRLHGQKAEGGSVPEEFRQAYISDRVHTVGTAFLGLTMECTKCHDHKYDPLTQKDYFSMAAFFSNIDEFGLYPYMHGDTVPTPSLALSNLNQEKQLATHKAEITRLEQEYASLAISASGQVLKPVIAQDYSKEKAGGRGLNGDHAIRLEYPQEKTRRQHPVTASLRLFLPEAYERAWVYGQSQATLDAGYRGITMMIEDGRATVKVAHFYPGNAIEIVTRDTLPIKRWTHLTMSYDGSSRAEGVRLYLDGKPMPIQVRYDTLTNKIDPNKGFKHVVIGAVGRDKGLKGARLKSFDLFETALNPSQVQALHSGAPVMQANSQIVAKQAQLQAARQKLYELQDRIPRIMTMRETAGEPVKTHILNRGEYNQPGEEVQPAMPEILKDFIITQQSNIKPARQPGPTANARRLNRLDFARSITLPNHPLTARVAVNRYWQMFFGTGLVSTAEDFGNQGAVPSHPELLDWLARDFVDSGWNLQHLIKQIVLSHSYRQSSQASLLSKEQQSILIEQDPENTLLSHFPAGPLSAEMLRDNALAIAGLLAHRVGGHPVRPYDLAHSFKGGQVDKGEGLYRRSLYTHWQVNGPSPLMLTLDAAKRQVCSVKREQTTTPLQSLVLLNSPQFVEAARMTAGNLLATPDAAPQRIKKAIRMTTGRSPSEQESKILTELYQDQLDYFQQHPQEALEFLKTGNKAADPKLPPAEFAALANTVLTLLNYDKTLIKH
jgi:hypothetical protein